MRIGIITQPLMHNYGGVLQNYALQQILQRLGHNPRTIDYLPPGNWGLRLKHIVWSYLHFRRPNEWWDSPTHHRIVKNYIRHHIIRTYTVRKYRPEIVRYYRFEAIIAGSDQIWRPEYNRDLYDMYFQFVDSLAVKKIVYGASFGTDRWGYNTEQTQRCRYLIHKADAVSVRENSGVELCDKYFDIKPQWVLDPTLLLDVCDYEQICSQIQQNGEPYTAVYLLNPKDDIVRAIEKASESLNMQMRMFSAGSSMTLSVEEWLAMFRDAKYVITDSFHGTIFSIIFNKPFISIGNRDRGMSRFYSLLKQFELEDRLSPDISTETLLRPISWDNVNSRKKILKESSIRFLEDSLQIDV